MLKFKVNAGDVDYVFVDGDGSSGGQYTVNISVSTPLPYDSCPGVQIPLSGTGSQPRTGSTSGSTATLDDDFHDGSCSGKGPDAVFSFTSDIDGVASVDMGGSTLTNYDAVLAARMTCDDASSQITCDYESTAGADKIKFPVVANTPSISSWIARTGVSRELTVNVSVSPGTCGDGIVQPPEQCDDVQHDGRRWLFATTVNGSRWAPMMCVQAKS